jgi:lipopolysaccharide transport system ATP-binding protein
MEDVKAHGRTILFVSHSMPSVLRLCPRVILLDRGRIVVDGNARDVIRTYLESGLGSAATRRWESREDAPGDDVVRLKSVSVLDHHGEVTEEADIRHPIDVAVEFWLRERVSTIGPGVVLTFMNSEGLEMFVSTDLNDREWHGRPRGPGVVRSVCRVPGNLLAEGEILVKVAIATQKPTALHLVEPDAVAFHVVDPSGGDTARGELGGDWPGVVRPMLDWTIDVNEEN